MDASTKLHAVVMYSTSGTLIISQYYTDSIPEERRLAFENAIFQRALEDSFGQVLQHEEFIVLYKPVADILVFFVCDLKANELMWFEIMNSMVSAMSLVFKGKVNTETLMKQIDLLYLLLDETIENGYVFEADPEVSAARALLKDDKALAGKALLSGVV